MVEFFEAFAVGVVWPLCVLTALGVPMFVLSLGASLLTAAATLCCPRDKDIRAACWNWFLTTGAVLLGTIFCASGAYLAELRFSEAKASLGFVSGMIVFFLLFTCSYRAFLNHAYAEQYRMIREKSARVYG